MHSPFSQPLRCFVRLTCLLLGVSTSSAFALSAPVRLPRPFHHQQPYLRFVHYVRYQDEQVPQKRTPVRKLPRQERATIARMEALLAATYHALLASDTVAVFPATQQDSLYRAWSTASLRYPQWNYYPYRDEANAYGRLHAQRQLAGVQQRFARAQHQLDSLRAHTLLLARTMSFSQAAHAGYVAQQAQQWGQAEVYFARCLVLRPADLACRTQHAACARACLHGYFYHFKQLGDEYWRQTAKGEYPAPATAPCRWPTYGQAAARLTAYLDQLDADYTALWQAGQRFYLASQLDLYYEASALLPAQVDARQYTSRIQPALAAYLACHGADRVWQDNQQVVRQWEQEANQARVRY